MSGGIEDLDLAGIVCVLGDVLAERVHQVVDHGRTPEHDDSHDRREWAWLLGSRVHNLATPWEGALFDERRQLIEVAAIAVAAIQAHDRRRLVPAGGVLAVPLGPAARSAERSLGPACSDPGCESHVLVPAGHVHWHMRSADDLDLADDHDSP